LQKQPVPTLRNQRGEVTARDLLERASVEYSVQGPRATRVFLVEGMAGPEEARLAGAPYVTGIPQVGELHPAIPLLPVSSVRAELAPGCTTNALVTVEYSQATDGGGFINPPDETARAAIEIVSTVQTATTNKDVNGNQILVATTRRHCRVSATHASRNLPTPGELQSGSSSVWRPWAQH
jgi:hypothetical protein